MNTQIQAHTIRRAIASETLSDVTSACRLLSASSVDEHGGLILVIGFSNSLHEGRRGATPCLHLVELLYISQTLCVGLHDTE